MADHIISVDAGNGGVNAILAKKRGYKSVYFPSVRAAATGDSLGLGSQFELDYEYVDWDGHRYLVGDDVGISKRAIERHQGAFRYGDEFHLFLIAVAIARLDVKSGSVDLTAFAAPGLYFDAKEAIERRFKEADGNIALQFKSDKKPRAFTIERVSVHPEGLGALLCFVMDKSGQPVKNDLLEGENVVLDMGMHTLDALQISGGQFNPESLSSATWENSGLKTHIIDPILRAVKKQGPDFSLLTEDAIDRVLRKGLATGDYTLTVAGLSVDIEPLVTKNSERYAQWIANNIIDGVFDGLRGIKSAILVGGGTPFVRRYLDDWYGGKLLDPDGYKTAKGIDPVDMNAVGGLRLALSRQTVG